jgi:hypothetical protein
MREMTMAEVATLVAVPPAALAQDFIRLSAAISELVQSEVVLGISALPHLTIVQWSTVNSERLMQRVKEMPAKVDELVLAGLRFLPDHGEIWIEVAVLNATWLRRTQQEAVSAANGLGNVVNATGERYRPHITVGLTRKTEISGTIPLPFPALCGASKEWSLAVGTSGPNYTLPEVRYYLNS